MRIQEHLFQGFFGIKKKKDAAKYYSERVNTMKGLDADLDRGITEFQKIMANHKKKLDAHYNFLHKFDRESLDELKRQIKLLEGMFDPDEVSNRNERRYVLRIADKVSELIKNEESNELSMMERDVLEDLKTLLKMLETLGPLWEKQLDFIEKNDIEILNDHENVRIITDILKEEGDVLKMEEALLRKIDLKTGAILRKTTLMMRDLEKTKDMNMQYRNIKHIR